MQFDKAGAAAWVFTEIKRHKESVTGKFHVSSVNQKSVLKFIEPEFSFYISDTLHLHGFSDSTKEYKIKAIRH